MRRRERIHDEIMIIRMELESRRGNVSTSGAGESGALAESGSATALSAAALKELEIKNKEKAIDVLQAGRRSVLAARWAKDKQGTDQPRILAENATY
ncbi:MAG: hypothetical protein BJ554DRAFT_1310 [Olpidium bornovanus]|uniref:Uncharacterized protein n=1 Tax=Olpidium bornovanus TaxID=278681 RepID=A0A8H7ZRS3_9FUNG|nr:MAG: hypothetical protein BJ554DRAFT_1310 [Olpidium bornovanus]